MLHQKIPVIYHFISRLNFKITFKSTLLIKYLQNPEYTKTEKETYDLITKAL